MIIIQWKRMQPEWEKTKKKRIGVEGTVKRTNKGNNCMCK